MDYLVQNTAQAPIFLPIVKMKEGKPASEGTIVFEGQNSVTKISDEVYENLMLKNPFYRDKIEKGILVVLNAKSNVGLDEKVSQAIQTKELGYARYVSLIEKINASGGIAEARLRPYLDAQGMPSHEMCRKNLGQIDPQIIDEYRSRYLVEKENGLHKGTLVIPDGLQMTAGVSDVEIVKEEKTFEKKEEEVLDNKIADYENMTIEQLKAKADELGITYSEDISFNRLLNRIKKSL